MCGVAFLEPLQSPKLPPIRYKKGFDSQSFAIPVAAPNPFLLGAFRNARVGKVLDVADKSMLGGLAKALGF